MRQLLLALALGVAIGAAAASLVFVTRHHRSWQEQEAQALAHGLACNGTTGLNIACAPITDFHETAAGTWELRLGSPPHARCFHVVLAQPARAHACT
jgi:hypothetical protein